MCSLSNISVDLINATTTSRASTTSFFAYTYATDHARKEPKQENYALAFDRNP